MEPLTGTKAACNANSPASELRKHNSPDSQQGKPSPSTRRRNWVKSTAPAIMPGTRRDQSLKEKRKNWTIHRPTTYRDHSTRPTVIPPYALPRASWALLAAIPWRLVHTYILVDYITKRGLGRVHMGLLAALRGLSVRALQYHLEDLEALGFVAIVENRVSYDWCEANSFFFLEDKRPNQVPLFYNCILPVVALNTRTINTKSQPVRGKGKAKISHREKMEAIWRANHPPGTKIEWYKRRKIRDRRNWQPEVREAYEAQGVVWAAMDAWRKAHPQSREQREAQAARIAAEACVGIFDQAAWEASEYMQRRARMTPAEIDQERAAVLAELAELKRLNQERVEKRKAFEVDLKQRQEAARREKFDGFNSHQEWLEMMRTGRR